MFLELKQRNLALFWFGWFNIGLLLFALMMFAVDNTIVSGINAWIKPMKFAISIAVYSWTFGWLLHYHTRPKVNSLITAGVIITMFVEVALIYMQAFRGTSSHFNVYTVLDGAVFSIMGIFIAINSVINLYVAVLFFSKDISLDGQALWAWRAGLILFFLGGISGGWMVGQLSHTVGLSDGGPGLPFLNWSTVAGDIRAAHFATLHALQVLPLMSYFITTRLGVSTQRWQVAFIIAYSILCVYLHIHAYLRLPVLAV